jgi:hypothetical protein
MIPEAPNLGTGTTVTAHGNETTSRIAMTHHMMDKSPPSPGHSIVRISDQKKKTIAKNVHLGTKSDQ